MNDEFKMSFDELNTFSIDHAVWYPHGMGVAVSMVCEDEEQYTKFCQLSAVDTTYGIEPGFWFEGDGIPNLFIEYADHDHLSEDGTPAPTVLTEAYQCISVDQERLIFTLRRRDLKMFAPGVLQATEYIRRLLPATCVHWGDNMRHGIDIIPLKSSGCVQLVS